MQNSGKIPSDVSFDILLRPDNPIVVAVLLFGVLLLLTYIFFKFIVYPMQRKHLQTEQDLKNQIKIRLMQQAMKEQKIRSALFHETVENERKRIAKELHDGIGTILSSVKLQIEAFKYKNKINDSGIEKSITKLISAGDELRNVIHELRPLEIERNGIKQAVMNLVEDFSKTAKFSIKPLRIEFPEKMKDYIQISVYRILQELFQNAVKHSEANLLTVDIYTEGSKFIISYEDDGKGFTEESLEKSKTKSGYGLNNIIERVSHNGGNCDIDSNEGSGTKIHIQIPSANILENR